VIDQIGHFIWYELLTTDVTAARDFYGKVIGWSMKDVTASETVYTVMTAGDAPLGGLLDLPMEARQFGASPRWIGYVAADDIDATAAEIRRLGGAVLVPPTDSNIGRISIVADPQTATFALVTGLTYGQRRSSALDELGCVGWHELLAADRREVFGFYGELFGWQRACAETEPDDLYQLFSAGGQTIGGMLTKVPSVRQPCWLFYFNVDDISTALRQVRAGGGRILQGPIELPDGCWIARCVDPQGALFALQGLRGQPGSEESSDLEVGWSTKWGDVTSKGRMLVIAKSKR